MVNQRSDEDIWPERAQRVEGSLFTCRGARLWRLTIRNAKNL